MINIVTAFIYCFLSQLADTQRYLLREMTGPRTSAEQSLDKHLAETQDMAQQASQQAQLSGGAQTPSYGALGPVFPSPIIGGDELLAPVAGGPASDSEPDFMSNLFSDNATNHLSTAHGQYWSGQEQKGSIVSSVPSPAPATVTVANAGLSSSSRGGGGGGGGAVNKRSRGVATARGEPKPAKAARVARPKKPQTFPAPVTGTGQYYNCDPQQSQPPRVVMPLL